MTMMPSGRRNRSSSRLLSSFIVVLCTTTFVSSATDLVQRGSPTDGTPSFFYPLQQCEGACMNDQDCAGNLQCFTRSGTEPVPGCAGSGSYGVNYCSTAPEEEVVASEFAARDAANDNAPPDLAELGRDGLPAFFYPLQRCEGECRNDGDCAGESLVCFDRQDREPVPGCFGDGVSSANYCIESVITRPTPLPAPPPVAYVPAPTTPDVLRGQARSSIAASSTTIYPLGRCEGECIHDDDCEQGLHCFHRSGNEAVPNCSGQGVWGRGYCTQIVEIPGSVVYQPGEGTVFQNGVQLAQGLLSRVIATAGQTVALDGAVGVGGGMSMSIERFHALPDGAAVFSRDETDGWVYVSNSESEPGGVGAIYFNSHGKAIGYKMLLTGTVRNCGCGKTFWNTFLTCEEYSNGQIYEVDPWGTFRHLTVFGPLRAAYESAAYDNRNIFNPKFFTTIDEENGPLVRYSPDMDTVLDALETGDYTNLLKTAGPNAKHEYLVLNYVDDKSGTFVWTTNVNEGRTSAGQYFRNLEGLDVYDGMLYMTAKQDRQLFILDLDQMTFTESSTRSGAFDSQPDQIKRLLVRDADNKEVTAGDGGDHHDILYFCEDGGSGSGVHGRDTQGRYFTILQADDNEATNGGVIMQGETSGLAFSPDGMFMYVAFQHHGKILEVRRADGLPFNGRRLDIKYH